MQTLDRETISDALVRAGRTPARPRPANRSERRHGGRHRRKPQTMYSGELRESYRLRGHDADDPAVHELVDRGIAPLGGGAMGKGAAAFFINLPPEGTFEFDTPYFEQETERNDVPQQVVPYTGLGGSRIDQRIQNIGILSNIKLVFQGTLTVSGTGAVTANYGWPWNSIGKRLTVQANGQTSLFQVEPMDLRVRRNRLYRNPKDDISTAPATTAGTIDPNPGVIANGSYSVVLVYDIPIAHDPATLVGSLFAQSDANYLNWTLEPPLVSDLFSVAAGGAVTLTGNIFPTLTFFDIPYIDTQRGRLVAIPDLRWLHGMIGSNQPFQNTGDVRAPLIKNAGQLLAYYAYIDNGGAAQIDPFASLDEIRIEYGGNRRPLVWNPPSVLGAQNTERFNGRLRPGYLCIDLEAENANRDLIYPRGVSELNAVLKIAAGVTVNANAHVHFVEETLFSGT